MRSSTELELKLLEGTRFRVGEGWCQGAEAKDEGGCEVSPYSEDAAEWCLLGAYLRETTHATVFDLAIALGFTSMERLTDWNDEPGRTRGHVLARLTRAINKLKKAKS